jgi:hypothetical protein
VPAPVPADLDGDPVAMLAVGARQNGTSGVWAGLIPVPGSVFRARPGGQLAAGMSTAAGILATATLPA